MPPKRTKKTAAVPKIQGKLNFQRLPKPQTIVSPLVQVLSQYELMIMVTDQLSSADIIHLTATCKEIKMYLTDDETIYSSITYRANCDGKGIEARAKCFGHWNGDVTKANVQCGGSLCVPCDDCSAMVCNECRYHINYMTDMLCCKDDPSHWEYHEDSYAEVLEAVRRCHADHCGECPDFHSGNFPIESIRAAHLAGEARERRYCSKCEPDMQDEDGLCSDYLFDVLDMCEECGDWCCCNLSEHFVEDSWLCIPCFFKQEAEAYGRLLKREVYKWEQNEDGEERARKHVKTEYLCDCGRVADVQYLVSCRWCDEYIQTPEVELFLAGY
ncbi:hypothetical protein E4T49_03585 [Aureobasidium sp. EXF-10728]|nr:hypothetical protein E4T49_03585 [Aureobasidium sp. EXF-10728]